MKKILGMILVLCMIMSLVACGSVKENSKKESGRDSQIADETAWTPDQPIRIIVCYKAGGQSDLFARKLASIVEKNKFLDTSIVVVNVSDGNTNDGINALVDAESDGYTLLFHHNAFITLNATGSIDTSYEDVDFICETVEQPFLIVARQDSPFDSAEDLIEAVKSGETIPVGYSGFASPGYFALLKFLNDMNIGDGIQLVTYAGGSEAITAQLGGQIDLRSSNTGDAFAYIASGDIKPLVFLSDVPHTAYPDVETTGDMGSSNALTLRSGFFAPKGTPENIKQAIAGAIKKACETQEWTDFCEEQGAIPSYEDAASYLKKFNNDKESIDELMSVFSNQFAS